MTTNLTGIEHSDPLVRTVTFPGPAGPGVTLAPLRRGSGDPTFHIDAERAIWRTSLLETGPVTGRIQRAGPDAVRAQALPRGEDGYVWIACEHGAARSLRNWLRRDVGYDRDRQLVAAYWRRGAAGDDVAEAE